MAIAKEVHARLTPTDEARLTRARQVNREAIEAYLVGTHHYWKFSEEGLANAVHWFKRATELDPSYAPACAGLAMTYAIACEFWLWIPREVMAKSKEAARRAVQLDPDLAEAYMAMGVVKLECDFDWRSAEGFFRRSVELNPNSAIVLDTYALNFFVARGRFVEAVATVQKALEFEPLAAAIHADLGWVLCCAHRYQDSIDAVQFDEESLSSGGGDSGRDLVEATP